MLYGHHINEHALFSKAMNAIKRINSKILAGNAVDSYGSLQE